MASVFTKIIRGDIPSFKILEDESYFAFLDIRPINPGHTLVVPKAETDYLFDLEEKTLSGILLFARTIVPALEKTVPCRRIGLLVAGLEVPHAHLHLVPMIDEGDLTFDRAKPADPESLQTLAEKIRGQLS